jgi:tRNA U34 5-carboxymethylaminomethyl modifying GTPase MnmE/TrmE
VERERAIVTAHAGHDSRPGQRNRGHRRHPRPHWSTRRASAEARDEAESIGIQKSMEALADADLVLVVVDKNQALSEEDRELLRQVRGRPAIPHEMVLLDLYRALGGLDALTGATTNEDVLRLIFSQFCIGK